MKDQRHESKPLLLILITITRERCSPTPIREPRSWPYSTHNEIKTHTHTHTQMSSSDGHVSVVCTNTKTIPQTQSTSTTVLFCCCCFSILSVTRCCSACRGRAETSDITPHTLNATFRHLPKSWLVF